MPTKPHTPPPPGELRNVEVKFVSLVQKGANGRRFQVFKSADYVEPEEASEQGPKGLGEMIQTAVQKALQAIGLGKTEPTEVEKAGTIPGDMANQTPTAPPTFAAAIEAKEKRDAFFSSMYIFEDVLREIAWSNATDKVHLVSQAIDQFRDYILQVVPAMTIQKADNEAEQEAVDGDISSIEEAIAYVNVAKAGRKISTGRLARLKEAYARLGEVISETDHMVDPEEAREDVEVKKEELAQIVKEALAPVEERLSKLEGGELQTEPPTADSTAEIIKSAVAEALAPVTARLEKIEKARGISNAQPVEQAAKVEKAAGFSWGGLILPTEEAGD